MTDVIVPSTVKLIACKLCGKETEMLHQNPEGSSPRRDVCGDCEGKGNRRVLDSHARMRAAERAAMPFDETPAKQSRRGKSTIQ